MCFLFRRSESTKEKPVAFGLFLDMLLEFRRFRKLYIGNSDCFLSPLARSKSQPIKKLKTVTASRLSHKGNHTPNVEYYI